MLRNLARTIPPFLFPSYPFPHQCTDPEHNELGLFYTSVVFSVFPYQGTTNSFFIPTRGPAHETRAWVWSVILACKSGPSSSAAYSQPCPAPPPTSGSLFAMACLPARGRNQEEVNAPHSNWSSSCSGYSAIRVNLHFILLLCRIEAWCMDGRCLPSLERAQDWGVGWDLY